MERLLERLEAWLIRHHVARLNGAWLVGFSHGSDSTLLLWLLRELATRRSLSARLIAVHVDHGLRPSSAEDARRAQAFAHRLGLASRVERVSCRGETDARRARYRVFRRIADASGASALLLAHHQDDNLETLLFRLMRGTGPLGLAGIPELRQLDPPPAGSKATRVPGTRGSLFLLRPLLGTPKSRIEEARRALELPCLDDPSNRDPGLTPRNRIRHQILPALRARRPGALEALLDAARGLRHAAECEIAGFDGPRDGHADLPLAELQALSPWALELLWTRLLDALGKERPSRAKLRFLRELSGAARSGKRVESLGHWQAVRLRDRVRLCDWETD